MHPAYLARPSTIQLLPVLLSTGTLAQTEAVRVLLLRMVRVRLVVVVGADLLVESLVVGVGLGLEADVASGLFGCGAGSGAGPGWTGLEHGVLDVWLGDSVT